MKIGKYWAGKMRAWLDAGKKRTVCAPPVSLSSRLALNLQKIRADFAESSDLIIREVDVGGRAAALVSIEGMILLQSFAQGMLNPVLQHDYQDCTAEAQYAQMRDAVIALAEQTEVSDFDGLYGMIMSGFCVILLDGVARGIAVGMQGFSSRSVDEPTGETMQRGSREGFVEVIRTNLSMVRRRMKTPKLRFEMMTVGRESRTDVALCYLDGAVSPRILDRIRTRLRTCPLDAVLESGYLQPYLEDQPLSLFSSVGTSERPDTVCGKISEGRVAVFVDGTPDVLIVPYLFVEHFQSMDDYANRPFFATLTRWIKYAAFAAAVLLPGVFVAMGTWQPSLFPTAMLYRLAESEADQPFSLTVQALVIHLIYELMREAGLRLPKPLGHAVSILGGLVIGDAAVESGLIGSPMILVVALTAISSFVVPKLYEPIAVLRLAFIVIGGTTTLFGVIVCFCALLSNLCALCPYGVPYTAPVSPLRLRGLRDVLIRQSWKRLGQRDARIQHMPGSDVRGPEGGTDD